MNFSHTKAVVGLWRRVFAIAQFAFNFYICTFLQCASPFGQLFPADDAMPFGARLVLVAAFLFPARVGGEGEASVDRAVCCRAGFGVLTEKTNESDAIFAKHVFVFLSCPDWLGRPGAKGAALQTRKAVFRRSGADCLCSCKRRSRQSAKGNRNPAGWNCRTQAPSAGITLKPSPNERDMKDRPACTTASDS